MKEIYIIEYDDGDFEWEDKNCFTTYEYAEEYLINNRYEKKVDNHGFKYYEQYNNDRVDYQARIYKKNILR